MNPLSKIIIEDAEKIINKVNFASLNNKSILITGASGLLGTYLLACLHLLSASKKFKIEVNLLIHSDLPEFIVPFIEGKDCNIYQGDITGSNFCKTLPKTDYIIHAAGYGQPGRFMENPIKTIQINTRATLDLFEHLNKDGSYLFLSSSEVYNGLFKPPFNESQIGNTNTDHPRASYIEGKRIGETICNEYRKLGINAKSARLSLAFGPGTKQHDKRVLNNFIEKALTSGKIDMLDQGEAKRTYCYITDAVEMLWNILLFGNDAIYNVGGISRITIAELAKLVAKETGTSVVFPENSSNLLGAPDDVYLDLTKIEQEFNKHQFVPIEEGVRNTINWQKNLYNSKTQF